MPRILTCVFCCTLGISACSDFPDLDGRIGQTARRGAFPELVPLDLTLLTATDAAKDAQTLANIMLRRIALLKVRARALRQPVLDNSQRDLIAAAKRRHGR